MNTYMFRIFDRNPWILFPMVLGAVMCDYILNHLGVQKALSDAFGSFDSGRGARPLLWQAMTERLGHRGRWLTTLVLAGPASVYVRDGIMGGPPRLACLSAW